MKKLKYAVLALAAIALVGCGANKDTAKCTTGTTSVTCTTSSKTSAASKVSSSTSAGSNTATDGKTLNVVATSEKYKDEVIMANPAVSGTSFANVKGLLDKYGEEKGWEYFTKLNNNIKFYGERGKDPQEKTIAGEFGLGIIPIDKSAFDEAEKNNLTAIYPKDGLCWVPEGVAIFKNSPNLEAAKKFEDFILRADIQQMIAELDGKDGAQMVIEGTKGYELGLPADKFIKEDIAGFGTQREAILAKWAEFTKGK